MITYGVILLIIGVICWAVGRGLPNRVALIAGQAFGSVGAILLIVGIVLLIVHGGLPEIHSAAML